MFVLGTHSSPLPLTFYCIEVPYPHCFTIGSSSYLRQLGPPPPLHRADYRLSCGLELASSAKEEDFESADLLPHIQLIILISAVARSILVPSSHHIYLSRSGRLVHVGRASCGCLVLLSHSLVLLAPLQLFISPPSGFYNSKPICARGPVLHGVRRSAGLLDTWFYCHSRSFS